MAMNDTRGPDVRSPNTTTILLVIVGIVAVVVLAWAAGLFNVRTEGSLRAPDVTVSGGNVPDVNVDTADIDVGTKQEEVTVPTIDVKPVDEK